MSRPDTPPAFELNDGTTLPASGFGTFGMTGEPGIAQIRFALTCGYRLLDTAVGYGNEREVGEAVRRSGLAGDVVLTTKIPGRGLGYDAARLSDGGIELTDAEMTDITALGRNGGRLWNGDPDTTGFM